MTDYRSITIGEAVDMAPQRALWACAWHPAWFIFTVPPRGEVPASAWLARNGVAETWYPSEQAFKRSRFRPKERTPYQRPIAPGYLFAVLHDAPYWDILFERSRGKLLKVVSRNGTPIAVPESVIANMAQVPQRLEVIKEAERQRNTIQPGDRARVSIGGTPWTVEVSRIHKGIASFIVPLLGGREVTADVSQMRKVVDSA